MIRDYQAAREHERIRRSSAFSIPSAKTRRKLNQHSTLYTFEDGSSLLINHTSQNADCWHKAWRGTAEDVRLGPIKGAPILVNRAGVE